MKRAKNSIGCLSIAVIILQFYSCSKVPTARFTFDKDEYRIGETITLTNASLNAKTIKWKGDGIDGEQTDNEIKVVVNRGGNYYFELTAYSNNKHRSNFLSKSIKVREADGQITFYAGTTFANTLYLSLDGKPIGTLNTTFFGAPACNDSQCVTVSVEGGSHWLEVTGGFYSYKQIQCVPNTCTVIQAY